MFDFHEAPKRVRDLALQFAQPKPMRRGSLSKRYVKCSKAGCACAHDPKARHGPYFSLTRGVGGRTRSRLISPAQAEEVRSQVEAGQHFRHQVEGFWEACEQWADAQLEGPAASEAAPKKGLQTALETEVVQEVEVLLGPQAVAELDFEALEVALRRGLLRLAARAIEQRLNADTSDETASPIRCRCGGEAHFVGRRSKQFQSVLGPLRLERAYYHCPACGHGGCPRDRHLGMENTSLSPALTRMTGTVGAMVSFQEGRELLQELAGVAVEAKQVERTAEALGQEIAADERRYTEPLDALPLPPTLYLGIDGTGIPLRAEELAGVPSKQPQGSAKTREVKLCTVWSAESFQADGTPRRDEGSVSYSAALESASTADTAQEPSAFAQRVWRETERRRFTQAARTVALGDGAPWIWNLVQELFPGTIQIVDRFHAKQHLSELGKALYGPTHPHASLWAERRHQELDSGRFRALLAAIRRHVVHSEEARRCLHYFQTNRARMRYPEFHAQGLCTSTGVVEAGCKVAIGTRLKRAGMHWTVRGSNAIIALRCSKLSGRFQDFWERRSESLAA